MKAHRTPFLRSSLQTIGRQFPATRACSQRERAGVRENRSENKAIHFMRSRTKARITPRYQSLCSQPISVHGVGTVRPWAAVNLTITQGRHNVSARDGGLPASRRAGAGAFLCALLRPLPRMHLLHSCQCIHSSNHAIARRTPLSLPPATTPIIHGPAAAAGPASFITQTLPGSEPKHLSEKSRNCKTNPIYCTSNFQSMRYAKITSQTKLMDV
jgi:hypothetical protein